MYNVISTRSNSECLSDHNYLQCICGTCTYNLDYKIDWTFLCVMSLFFIKLRKLFIIEHCPLFKQLSRSQLKEVRFCQRNYRRKSHANN